MVGSKATLNPSLLVIQAEAGIRLFQQIGIKMDAGVLQDDGLFSVVLTLQVRRMTTCAKSDCALNGQR